MFLTEVKGASNVSDRDTRMVARVHLMDKSSVRFSSTNRNLLPSNILQYGNFRNSLSLSLYFVILFSRNVTFSLHLPFANHNRIMFLLNYV